LPRAPTNTSTSSSTGKNRKSVRALVDTGALIALSRRKDQCHSSAIDIAERHLGSGGQFVGTTLILAEFHSHLLYLRGAAAARAALSALLEDPVHDWMPVSSDLQREAIGRWLVRFADQDFSLVDAVSFEVMRRHRLTHAFAFDQHFAAAGVPAASRQARLSTTHRRRSEPPFHNSRDLAW